MDICFAKLHSMHMHLPLLPEDSAHSPWIQTMLVANLSSPLKNVFMYATLLRHETILLVQEKNLLPHC